MNNFYQSPEFLNAVAASTVALIAILFIVGLHPFKEKKATNIDLWVADDYFRYLKTIINASRDMDELEAVMELVDGFHHKRFRVPIAMFTRNRYYIMLLDVYAKKEKELLKIPVELCAN